MVGGGICPGGGMADAGDLKSPDCNGRGGSSPPWGINWGNPVSLRSGRTYSFGSFRIRSNGWGGFPAFETFG